jgi:invasion protein IalB
MTKSNSFKCLIAASVLASAVLTASAAGAATDPKGVGTFGAWSVFTFEDDGKKACFMSSKPEKTETDAKNIRRGEASAFVTHWTADNTKNGFSVAVGFPFSDKTAPKAKVQGQEFTLITTGGEIAWAQDAEADAKIAEALQKGQDLRIESVSKRGTKITDIYSLKGSGEAYKAMTEACAN